MGAWTARLVISAAALAACSAGQPDPATVVVAAAPPVPEPVEVAASPAKAPEARPDAPPRSADTTEDPSPTTMAPAPPRPPPAPAVAAAAQARFDEGRQLMAQGAFQQACVKLEQSLRLDPAVGTMLNLAVCEERAGHVPKACALFREVARQARADGRSDRALVAEEHGKQLGCPR